ncbi:hypothetical protein EPA93_29035 [Ktedonosporobacter rubrisoli]|uniref:Uncharacterized protein n=1 Tax=Ktedonosporobacter rubrisoli TaxID=2509675 RepID=A0A4P6JVV8_KTERU|nr:hypothetical protein [Ktedonosporobacter rubrisoli]QBD79807.1 hypothetical protein EPA93_29035 [Ktedonosporobacter rubrisoli]
MTMTQFKSWILGDKDKDKDKDDDKKDDPWRMPSTPPIPDTPEPKENPWELPNTPDPFKPGW